MVEIALRIGAADPLSTVGEGAQSAQSGAACDELDERGRATPPPDGWRAGLRSFAASAEGFLMLAATVGVAAMLASSYEHGLEDPRVFPGVRIDGASVGGLEREALRRQAEQLGESRLDRSLKLVAGPVSTETTARRLGARPAPEATIEAALAHGRDGGFFENLAARAEARRGEADLALGMTFDEHSALDELLALAPEVERPSLPTRLDFERRKVVPAERGTSLLPWDSLSSVAIGLAAGGSEIELAVQSKPPVADDPLADLADELDISTVLGRFSTNYHTDEAHRDRTHNLKLGAAALDGTVVMPGEVLSFNEVVGERSVENGYRYAGGLSAGQVVDTEGGGICQVASTLYGAGFFGGLGIVRHRPHSRPSSYVDMGLDATVVYPIIDLKLRNDFDFPIVVHMSVNHGSVEAEILGPRRPYQIAFDRQLEEIKPYPTVYRDDSRLQTGTTALAQAGMRGFGVKLQREFISGGEVVKSETIDLDYPPTSEIVRRGTSPSGEVPDNPPKPKLREPQKHLRMVQ